MLWPCSSYGIPIYGIRNLCQPKNQLQHHVHHQQDHLYWHLTRSQGATQIPVVDQSDRISGNLGMVHNQIWDSQKLYENDDVSILNNEEHDASIKNLQKGSV